MNLRLPNPFARIPRPTRCIAAIILGHKAVFTVLLFLAPILFPPLFPRPDLVTRRFRTWDSDSYCKIAASGYAPKSPECAFYPLWPLCIRLGSVLVGGKMLFAGYILANIMSLVSLLLFHRFAWERHGLPLANRATILLLLFPGSIFFFFPYTESLFLLLLVVFMFSVYKEKYRDAAFAAFYLPMTRAVGIFILPLLFWELFHQKRPPKAYLVSAAPVLGYLCYFGILYFYTGNPLEGFAAQQRFPARPSIARVADPEGFLQSFLDLAWAHDMLHSFVDRGFFLFFLATLYPIFRLNRGYALYSIFAGVIPAISNVLMSYTRFLSLIFPFFLVLGQFAFRRWIFWGLSALFGTGQLYFFFRHVAGKWVG